MSFIINSFRFALNNLAEFLILTDSTNSINFSTSQRVIFDSNYIYAAIRSPGNNLSYVMRASFDFSTADGKEQTKADIYKREFFTLNWINSGKTELLLSCYENNNSGAGYPSTDNYPSGVKINASTLTAATVNPNIPYMRLDNTVPYYNNTYVNVADINTAGDVVMTGQGVYSTGNYLRTNSAYAYQSDKYLNIPNPIDGALMVGDILYVCGSGLAAINTSTDALVSAYNLTRASFTYRMYDIIKNSIDSNLYSCGRMLTGSEIYGYVIKLSSDLTGRVFDIQYDISESNKNTYFYGLCERGDYIYVIARYIDASSVNYGAVLKINRTDGSVVEKLGITGNTNTFFLPTSIGVVDNRIFIYAYARPYDATRTDAVVLRLDTDDFSELHGKSTSGGEFSFFDITVATADPLATYGVSVATFVDPTDPTSDYTIRNDMDSAGNLTSATLVV